MAMSRFERKMKEYDVLLEALKTSVIVSEQGLKWYKDNADISIGENMVSSELLKRLLTVEDYYEYVEMLFSDKIDKYIVNCIIDLEESKEPITLSKVEIVKGINECITKKLFELDETGKKRLIELSQKLDFKLFENKVLDSVFSVDIDGENFKVDAMNILNFLNYPDKEYEEFFDLEKESNIFGIPKDKFVYLVVQFIDQYDIFSKYLVPDKVATRYKELESSKRIDIEAMNLVQSTYYPFLNKIKINSKFKKEILDGLPLDVSDLEKAAYIYIKVCKSLVYDGEYYVFAMKNIGRINHSDISRLEEINSGNNDVVCYEINAILAYFFNELGIKFNSDVNPIRFGGFGGREHADLGFRDGKYLVSVDAVTSVLNSDLTRSKLNQPLKGFFCANDNEKTKQEFSEKVSRMYELVVKQEKEKNGDKSRIEVEKEETFDDIVSKYKKLSILKKISLTEKFKITIEKAEQTDLYKMDVFSYLLQLKKIIFSKDEQQENIKMLIIRKNISTNSASANIVISFNKSNFDEDPDETIYYVHDGYSLRLSSKEEIVARFNFGTYSYIEDSGQEIPGIGNNNYKWRR